MFSSIYRSSKTRKTVGSEIVCDGGDLDLIVGLHTPSRRNIELRFQDVPNPALGEDYEEQSGYVVLSLEQAQALRDALNAFLQQINPPNEDGRIDPAPQVRKRIAPYAQRRAAERSAKSA